ncbi:conserved hypothetical protein [Shewanella sediminis HAW-EB3]|uniref:Uncharacterized protein n=1 Tax=Shewanella sediminis (strain HAW-EB3) TaxID=425104 RepID=A8FSX8_SHESH|nr:DUF481 domain-containing protein [Shewanella sediminis]ABV35951.1 conserved hypothetical protein [Shewanella sediminis HAW-EB3]
MKRLHTEAGGGRLQFAIKTLVSCTLLLSSFMTLADESKLRIAIGSFYSTSDSGMEVISPLTDESFELDFESDLKLTESEFLPFFEVAYWFNGHHGVYLDWKRLHRDATNLNITTPFEYEHPETGDKYLVQSGSVITTTFNVDIARIGYGYDFYRDDEWDLILTAGLHVMWFELGFSGDIAACVDNNCGSVELEPDNIVFTDATAPLPDIGVVVNYQFADGWQLGTQAQYFYLSLDNISGRLVDLSAGIEYTFRDSFATELSYKYYKVSADIEDDNSTLKLHYGFQGPMLTLSYTF